MSGRLLKRLNVRETALWKAMSWSGANSVLRIVLAFFSAKVSALFLGPAGMALVGEIANFIQVSTGAIANGAQTAVVNLTAERRSSPARLQELWATAIWSVLLMSGLVALVVLSSASTLSSWLLFDAKYWPVIVAGGFVVMLAVVDTVLIGALNGLKQIKLIASASIACTIVEFILFAGLTYTFGIWGGLVGMTAVYGSKLAVSSWIAFRSKLISPRALFSGFDRATLRDIWKFYPMLIAHSIALPLAQLLVRGGTVRTLGLEQGGYLQAAWRLSDMYVGVITTALGFYFMAYFSSLEGEGARGELLRRTIVQLCIVTACCASAIYLLRDVIIAVVLTSQLRADARSAGVSADRRRLQGDGLPAADGAGHAASGRQLHRAGHLRAGAVCRPEHRVAPLAGRPGGAGGLRVELRSRVRGSPLRAARDADRQERGAAGPAGHANDLRYGVRCTCVQ